MALGVPNSGAFGPPAPRSASAGTRPPGPPRQGNTGTITAPPGFNKSMGVSRPDRIGMSLGSRPVSGGIFAGQPKRPTGPLLPNKPRLPTGPLQPVPPGSNPGRPGSGGWVANERFAQRLRNNPGLYGRVQERTSAMNPADRAAWAQRNPMWDRAMRFGLPQNVPHVRPLPSPPMTKPTPPWANPPVRPEDGMIRLDPREWDGTFNNAGGGYDGSGINPGGMYNKPMGPLPPPGAQGQGLSMQSLGLPNPSYASIPPRF